MNYKNTNRAFSLIELSIVILIIGLLIAGITKGSELYYKMKIATAQRSDNDLTFHLNYIGGVSLRLDALNQDSFNQNEVSDGSRITNWYDVKPEENGAPINLSQSGNSRPYYKKNGVNGLPSVKFKGGGATNIKKTNLSAEDLVGNRYATIFIVQNRLAGGANIFRWDDGQKRISLGGARSTSPYMWFDYGIYPVSVPNQSITIANNPISSLISVDANNLPVDAIGKPHILALLKNGNLLKIRYDGQFIAGVDSGATAQVEGTRAGLFEIGQDFDGLIGEFVVFNKALSTAEIKKIEGYLGQKWGIEVIH